MNLRFDNIYFSLLQVKLKQNSNIFRYIFFSQKKKHFKSKLNQTVIIFKNRKKAQP